MTVERDQIELGDSQSGKCKFRAHVGEAMFEIIYIYAPSYHEARQIGERAGYHVRSLELLR